MVEFRVPIDSSASICSIQTAWHFRWKHISSMLQEETCQLRGMNRLTVIRAFNIPQIFSFWAFDKDPVKPNHSFVLSSRVDTGLAPMGSAWPKSHRLNMETVFISTGLTVSRCVVNCSRRLLKTCGLSAKATAQACANWRCAAKVKIIFLSQERQSPDALIVTWFSSGYSGLSSESNEDLCWASLINTTPYPWSNTAFSLRFILSKALKANLDFQIPSFHHQSSHFQRAALASGAPSRGPPKAIQSNSQKALIWCVQMIKPTVDEDEEQSSELNWSKVPLSTIVTDRKVSSCALLFCKLFSFGGCTSEAGFMFWCYHPRESLVSASKYTA